MTRRDWLLLISITLVAAALRFYQLGVVPPGPQFDEAFNAIDAEQVLAGNRPLFLPANGGREVLYTYYQAVLGALLGLNLYTLRLASALAGVLTIPAVYLMVRRLFQRHSQLLAAFTALALALSYWHIHFSHYGIRIILMPLIFSGVFGLFWVGMHGESSRIRAVAFIASGILAGLGVWNNPTGRLAPLVLGLYALWLLWRYPERRPLRRGALLDNPIAGLLVAGAAALVVFLPLGLEFVRHPEFFLGHASEVSVFADRVSGDRSPALLLALNVLRVLGMFSFDGDMEWAHGIAGRPVFDWFMAAVFYVGVAVWFWRLIGRKQARSDSDQDALFLMLLWAAIMLAPSVFSEAAPNYSRTLAAVPPVMLAPGLGLAWLVTRPQLPATGAFAVAGLLLVLSLSITVYDYFVRFPAYREVYYVYDADKVDAINWLKERADQNSIYLSPLWSEHATVAYLRDSRIKSLDATETIVLPQPGKGAIYAYPAEQLDYAEDVGERWGVEPALVNDRFGRPLLAVVQLTPDLAATWPGDWAPDQELEARFDDGPTLIGMHAVDERVTLFWRAEARTYRDLTAFVHLVDRRNRRVAQADKLPGNGLYRTPSWTPGERIAQQFTPDLLDPCSGGQTVRVLTGWYEYLADGQRRPRADAAGDVAFAGEMEVPWESAPVSAIQPPEGRNIPLALFLSLTGFGMDANQIEPGAPLTLDLYLLSNGAHDDLAAELSLVGDGTRVPLWAGALAPGATWREGEVLCRRLELRLPSSTLPGDYLLHLTTAEYDQPFAALTVAPASRQYDLPLVQRQLDAMLGDSIRLHGADVVQESGVLTVTLVWQAQAPTAASDKVFVHLIDPAGTIVAQSDALPAGGYGTDRWVEGEVVVDTHTLELPPDLLSGEYRLLAGMYDPATGQRLAATAGDGQPYSNNAIDLGPLEAGN